MIRMYSTTLAVPAACAPGGTSPSAPSREPLLG